jgi:hypothetical protein
VLLEVRGPSAVKSRHCQARDGELLPGASRVSRSGLLSRAVEPGLEDIRLLRGEIELIVVRIDESILGSY